MSLAFIHPISKPLKFYATCMFIFWVDLTLTLTLKTLNYSHSWSIYLRWIGKRFIGNSNVYVGWTRGTKELRMDWMICMESYKHEVETVPWSIRYCVMSTKMRRVWHNNMETVVGSKKWHRLLLIGIDISQH